MKKGVFIFALFCSLYGYANASGQGEAPAQIISLKRVGSEIIEFNKITAVHGTGEFQFSVATGSIDEIPFGIFYEHEGKIKKITSNFTRHDRPFFFPGKGKSLELTSAGQHVFIIEFDKNQSLRTTVLVEPDDQLFSTKRLNPQTKPAKQDHQLSHTLHPI